MDGEIEYIENIHKHYKGTKAEELSAYDDLVNNLLNEKIEKQIERTRSEESSPKNTTLHFGLLLETKDLVDATMNLLEEYHNSFDSSIEPATISVSKENK